MKLYTHKHYKIDETEKYKIDKYKKDKNKTSKYKYLLTLQKVANIIRKVNN